MVGSQGHIKPTINCILLGEFFKVKAATGLLQLPLMKCI